jgi:CubicO group peptidase (beta-lactamase class C family)
MKHNHKIVTAFGLTPLILGLLVLVALLPGCKLAEEKFDRYLKAAGEIWGFSGTVLIAWHGEIVFAKGYGYADQTFGQANTLETKFYIGSITKQFTAAAILKLVEQGKISLDDPITRYLPDYPTDPGKKITIHHLLTHTSGVPNYTEFPELLIRRTSRISPNDLLKFFENEPLDFEPGTGFHYSNSGYIILGAIIERVSGQSYEAFLHKEFLKKIGMLNSGYARREAALPNRAVGYTLDMDRNIVNAPAFHFSVLHTAGALYSTVEDMLKWDKALYADELLSRQSIRTMLTPHARGYGYGWFIERLWGRTHTFHGGFLDGFNTTFERWLEDQLCIIVFSNEDEAPVKKIARGLAAIAFQEDYDFPVRKQPIALDPAALAEYEGVYQVSEDRYRMIQADNDRLIMRTEGEMPEHLLPEAPDLFYFARDNSMTMRFIRDRDSVIVRHEVRDQEGVFVVDRLPDTPESRALLSRTVIELKPSEFSAYTGVYRLESHVALPGADFTLTVARDETRLLAAPTGLPLMPILPHTKTEFFYENSDVWITFTTDTAGAVTGCILRLNNAEVAGVKLPPATDDDTKESSM